MSTKTTPMLIVAAWLALFSLASADTIYTPVPLDTNITLHCPEVASNHSNCSSIVWSKDGTILQSQTELTYTLFTVQFADGGNYSCDSCGAVEEHVVVVGEKPKRPSVPECPNSPNTTIWCFLELNDDTADSVCLTVYAISRFGSRWRRDTNCIPYEKRLNVSIDLDHQMANRYELEVIARNDFGQSSSTKLYYLSQKVTPDPPVNVRLETTTGSSSFKASFDVPDSWKPASYLEYEYRIRHLNTTTDQWELSNGARTVNFQFRLDEEPIRFSLVCLQVKIKFGSILANNWSNYSQEECNYTETHAPSTCPEDFHSTADKENGEFRDVSFCWSPPPEDHRNGIIEEYVLLVEEVKQGLDPQQVFNEPLPGDSTNFNLPGFLKADRTYVAKLSAWTSKGGSPPAVVVLVAFRKDEKCPPQVTST